MPKTTVGNPKCKCGRVATRLINGRRVCNACESTAGRRISGDEKALYDSLLAMGIDRATIERELLR